MIKYILLITLAGILFVYLLYYPYYKRELQIQECINLCAPDPLKECNDGWAMCVGEDAFVIKRFQDIKQASEPKYF